MDHTCVLFLVLVSVSPNVPSPAISCLLGEPPLTDPLLTQGFPPTPTLQLSSSTPPPPPPPQEFLDAIFSTCLKMQPNKEPENHHLFVQEFFNVMDVREEKEKRKQGRVLGVSALSCRSPPASSYRQSFIADFAKAEYFTFRIRPPT